MVSFIGVGVAVGFGVVDAGAVAVVFGVVWECATSLVAAAEGVASAVAGREAPAFEFR
jgi:hypothetical protein